MDIHFSLKVFDLMGRSKEDEEMIKISVRDKMKKIQEVRLRCLNILRLLCQDLCVGDDKQISIRLFAEYCAAKC